ncbi:unnamed protein product [Callosobruchus maculatus]|uniref:Uncharacterized protein n=1 Tax=Callosobruchus maculatus TaxID=64391 RepID=A0A653CK00_CALMS|nr:unnamed protein product [Callosobruchus maculatus]
MATAPPARGVTPELQVSSYYCFCEYVRRM